MERLRERILAIVENEMPRQSLGLNVLGVDVCFGIWQVVTPQGPAQVQSFAILTAIRPAGPKGEVLLGNVPPITNSHVLQSLWPTELEIRAAIRSTCDALRQYLDQQRIQANGSKDINTIIKDTLHKQPEGD